MQRHFSMYRSLWLLDHLLYYVSRSSCDTCVISVNMKNQQLYLALFYCFYKWTGQREDKRHTGGILKDKTLWEAVVRRWYSMWQTPGTHATSTFHAAHSLDAGLPQCPCLPPSTALCARIISQQRRRCRWSHPSEGSPPPLSPITLFPSLPACSCLSTLAACILSLFSPWRGDTKRHLPGRDKPILKMPKREPDAPHLFFPLFPSSFSLSLTPRESWAEAGFKHH